MSLNDFVIVHYPGDALQDPPSPDVVSNWQEAACVAQAYHDRGHFVTVLWRTNVVWNPRHGPPPRDPGEP
jgi:hypothetical protein